MTVLAKTIYQYRIIVVKVVDGDTIFGDLDLGWGVWLTNQYFRLARINSIELNKPNGIEARERLISLLPGDASIPGREILINSIKDKKDKYKRFLIEIPLIKGSTVNDEMVKCGYAVYS
ncbi:hypothetical protein PCC6912_39800 [Chlorogloeopsis fritschii PCC 6912]|uniref:TNase-like domain-containing protein n=1 Tax=Chlorogloeopsis fritschii PCC 6912 TaxID=211165 RepID=A0A433N6D8_CHLFR|nr:thermonuclease family protein [Chlorogloeopsis fritschii]RUR77021.1 hypothetical protein PCC6912_39800 [Chlorogloeopsis fritschii PCC 6912]